MPVVRGRPPGLAGRDHRHEQGVLLVAQGLPGAEVADPGPALRCPHDLPPARVPLAERRPSQRVPLRSPEPHRLLKRPLALPCHLRVCQAFLPGEGSRRRGAMEGMHADGWEEKLEHWLEPFLARLRRKEQRRWAPVYLEGLILPGERKSVEPMAARVAPGDLQQLHHFVSTSPWATAPLEDELVKAADRLVGGPDAALVVDDTALVKQGRHSVGVKRQYCGQLGKKANCQALVSLTL